MEILWHVSLTKSQKDDLCPEFQRIGLIKVNISRTIQ